MWKTRGKEKEVTLLLLYLIASKGCPHILSKKVVYPEIIGNTIYGV